MGVIFGTGPALTYLDMLNSMGKKHWVVVLVLGAIGCSKVNLPRLGEGGRVDAPVSASMPHDRMVINPLGAMLQICKKLDESNFVLERRIAEYPRLQELIREMSPLLKSDPAAFQRAHREAFQKTNSQVEAFLKADPSDPSKFTTDPIRRTALNHFRRKMRENGNMAVLEGDERDLVKMLNNVLQLPEGESCSNLYLDLFYTNYIMSLDAFGEIMFGSTNTLAQPNTLGMSVNFTEPSVKNAQAVAHKIGSRGSATWFTLTQWESSEEATSKMLTALQSLEARGSGSTHEGIVLDLRYAGGMDRILLQKFQESASQGWGRLPIVVLTNASTRGVAAVFAYNLAQQANVKALGTDEFTYGYGRTRTQQTNSLAENLSRVNIAVGTELMQPFSDGNRDGYRLRVTLERNMDEVTNQAHRLALNDELPAPVPQPPQAVQEIPDGGVEPLMVQPPPQEEISDAGESSVPLRAFGP